jgi:lysophospholipase L1-like esterase
MGVFPRREREDRIKNLNKVLMKVAREVGVGFADPGKELLKGRKIDESLFVDGLHPNEAGYECIASYYR